MVIYNVTINIEDDVHDAWLKWMNEVHIPQVMKTGYFSDARICRLMVEEESGGTTYATQYVCDSAERLEEYREKISPALQEETEKKFGGKFVAFRSVMELVAAHKP